MLTVQGVAALIVALSGLGLIIDAGIFILACEVTAKVAPLRRRAIRWWRPR